MTPSARVDRASAPYTSRVFGATVASAWPLCALAGAAAGPGAAPDVVVTAGEPLADLDRARDGEPLYVSPRLGRSGQSLLRIHPGTGGHRLILAGVGAFDVSASAIVIHPLCGVPPEVVDTHLLSSVLAFWQEQRGRLCLHGASVAIGQRAVVLLSRSGGGKSSLLAALLGRGHGFVTDDIAVLESRTRRWVVREGVPAVRLWPDSAGLLAADPASLPRVGDGSEKRRVDVGDLTGREREPDGGRPCAGVLLVSRDRGGTQGGAVQIEPLRGHAIVAELVRHSFVGRLVAATGTPEPRLGMLADLAVSVPCCRLHYPSGYERLPDVAAAIEQYVAREWA